MIIKPITGECGNSVDLVSNYNEEILRYKEGKVGGWIVQPKIKDIILGERSLIYIDGKLSHAVKKIPQGESLKVNARWQPQCEPYIPTNEERNLAEEILSFWSYKLLTVRIDLVQDGDTIRIMEVETVNPGFYLDKISSQELKEVLNRLERLISKLLKEKGVN